MTKNPQVAEKQTFTRRYAKPRPRTLMIMIFLLIIALTWGIYWWTTARWMTDTDDAYVRADIVTLAPRVSGYLSAVEVQDNQRVSAGQVLARIDDNEYQARVSQADAVVKSAEAQKRLRQAQIFNLDARQVQQKNRVDEAMATVHAALAESARAVLEAQRQQRLVSQHVSSEQQLESANAQMTKMVASVTQAQAALAITRQQNAVLASERQAAVAEQDNADAALRQAQAQRELARIDLASTAITSPITGTVGQRAIRAGQYVETGAPLLAVVPDNVYVIANFKETQLDHMHIGQPAEIRVDAYGGRHFRGTVDSFAPASGAQFALLPPDNATGNFTKIVQRMPVKIRLTAGQNAQDEIRPGMSVVVTVDTHHD
ncbi:HlyD family secretion protein [Pantoea sp. At-9b]|uniref:HlyD family secretion protein n=1 Tax=Pantoea sp. (strain At-9b) TaxID=592316 RepID=UPI0001B40718|nr:HlyD family secretion protein [Pantoea sp. At-9b]ADU72465.1 secretion protein HlyD family protein [Pantoea sp. At-9b]